MSSPAEYVARKAGIVYTPRHVAERVAEWAIRSADEIVLDPSAGDGEFLKAARARQATLTSRVPARQLFGVEFNRDTARICADRFSREATIIHKDFLTTKPEDFDPRVSVVLGNPPYVRHHFLSNTKLKQAASAVASHGMSRTGNYWAYFVLHALDFLAPGGRLALILPGSIVHGGYSSVVRAALTSRFRHVTAVFVNECIFPGVEEESVILLADGKRFAPEATCDVRIGSQSAESLDLSHAALLRSTRLLRRFEIEAGWVRGLLTKDESDCFQEFAGRVPALGRLATIRIGTVTGANDFFIRDQSDVPLLPRECWQTLVSKTAQLEGIRLLQRDINSLGAQGARLFAAVMNTSTLRSGRARAFIAEGVKLKLHERTKCRDRQPWFSIEIVEPPDAFLTYMNGDSPAIVINEAGVSCTNTIHALYRRGKASIASIAAGFLTTVAQLGAELEGRSYGGGVLKLEPSEAARIPIPTHVVDAADIRRLDQCRRTNPSSVRNAADVICCPSAERDELKLLQAALQRLRARRRLRHDTWRRAQTK